MRSAGGPAQVQDRRRVYQPSVRPEQWIPEKRSKRRKDGLTNDWDHVFVWNSAISDLKTRGRIVGVCWSKTSSGSGFYGLT